MEPDHMTCEVQQLMGHVNPDLGKVWELGYLHEILKFGQHQHYGGICDKKQGIVLLPASYSPGHTWLKWTLGVSCCRRASTLLSLWSFHRKQLADEEEDWKIAPHWPILHPAENGKSVKV
jgi:hypothetical protein